MNPTDRRKFLGLGGVAAAAAFVAACSGDDDDSASTDATTGTTAGSAAGGSTTTTASDGSSDDLATAAFAASLEQLAVNTYTAAGQAASSGALGTVPPAVAQFVGTALDQHQQALDKWNGVLTDAGEDAVSTTPANLEATVNQMLSAVTDVAGAAQLALLLEQTAASTYLAALPTLVSADAIGLAGELQYVDQQHAAVLLFALGQYPVPEVFQTTDKAATPG